MSRSRNHCFTLNNWTEADKTAILAWECKYVIVGEEVGEEKATPHLQGYVEWAFAKTLSTLKNLHASIHWEARKGSAEQAADYCKKDGRFLEVGTISCQGKRKDLDLVADMVIAKAPIDQIAAEHPSTFIKYHKGITALQTSLLKHRTEPPYVEWRWGLAGVGKTRFPVEKHPVHYIKDGSLWWDGYSQQEAIIIDDFDGKWPFRDLLRLLDRYQYQGQYKGGYVPIASPFIYITAEFPPVHYWSGNELAQVLRRLNLTTEVLAPERASELPN